jgi:hypothetical protein
VYVCDQAYGGPEEGGWWYDTGERIDETIRCFEEGDYPQIKNYVEMLERRYDERKYRVKYALEELVEESFPKNRPYYH